VEEISDEGVAVWDWNPGFRTLIRLTAIAMASMMASVAFAQQTPFLAPRGMGVARALIIGIDQYESLKPLKGAVADARDFEATLKKLGVRDLTVLVDSAVTRGAVMAAMERLQSASRPGDLVILTLAGHGAREEERVKGSNADGLDKSFLFWGFYPRGGPRTAERILSPEIKAWLYKIERKGVDVLFIADTCYGGGLVRSPDPRADELTYRSEGEIQLLQDELKPISTAADAFRDEADFERVTFMAAADKLTLAPEVSIPGLPSRRGALSYSVARTFEGIADRDKSGVITRRKLFEYSRQVVLQYSETKQTIWTEPKSTDAKLDVAVFRTDPSASAAPLILSNASTKQKPIRVRIVNGTGNPLSGVASLQVPFQIVGAGEPADLIWDANRLEVVSASGDVIAAGIEPHVLPNVVDRTGAVMAIAKLAESRPQSIVVRPNNAHHRDGEIIQFYVEGIEQKYMILFNIAADGTVQHLFPKKYDPPRWGKTNFEWPLRVQKPFGADHAVAIVSDRRLEEIEKAIVRLDGDRAAGLLPDILQPIGAADRTVRLGSAGLFTMP
jgi:Caspase domain/Domain of unknown function (DUF4384)